MDGAVTGVDLEHVNVSSGPAHQAVNIYPPFDTPQQQAGVFYTLREVLSDMDKKLDNLSEQMTSVKDDIRSIRFEQAAQRREIDQIKAGGKWRLSDYIAALMILILLAVVVLIYVVASGG